MKKKLMKGIDLVNFFFVEFLYYRLWVIFMDLKDILNMIKII